MSRRDVLNAVAFHGCHTLASICGLLDCQSGTVIRYAAELMDRGWLVRAAGWSPSEWYVWDVTPEGVDAAARPGSTLGSL